MRAALIKRLPLFRLAAYVLLFIVCGGVLGHELYFALASTSTTGTVLAVGTPPNRALGRRASRIWADYEYFDADKERHVGRAYSASFDLGGAISPSAVPGDSVEVQYLHHSPATSRLTPSPAGGICFGAVAALAVVVFVGEFVVRVRRRRKRSEPGLLGNP